MALSRTYPSGWALGDLLTTSQINAMDIAITNAADKRVAAVDQIGAIWQMVQPGRIVQSTFLAPDMTAILASGDSPGTDMRLTSGVTANRSYYLGSGSTARNGDRFLVWCDATFLYEASVYDQDSNVLLYVVGNKSSSDGNWAEFFFNGTAWVLTRDGHGNRLQSMDFTSYGEIVVPRGVFSMLVSAWGGGGAGGSAPTPSSVATQTKAIGGPGGAGSVAYFGVVAVTPGTVLAVTPGTGGSPLLGAAGGAGGDTTVGLVGGSVLARSRGGAGGGFFALLFNGADPSHLGIVSGGSGPAGSKQSTGNFYDPNIGDPPYAAVAGSGGRSGGYGAIVGLSFSSDGLPSLQGFAGGVAGTTGTTSGSYVSGAPGGGGGGGPGGIGGNGGASGNGNNGGIGTSGAPGTAADALSGAGGGGGGGAGSGSTLGSQGGIGGAGGSGRAKLYWIK